MFRSEWIESTACNRASLCHRCGKLKILSSQRMVRRSVKKRIAKNQFDTLQKLFDVSTPPPKAAVAAPRAWSKSNKAHILELPSDALLKCFGDQHWKIVCIAAQVIARLRANRETKFWPWQLFTGVGALALGCLPRVLCRRHRQSCGRSSRG